jgi:lipopolysaccharide biosynthesis glycosyltransferase
MCGAALGAVVSLWISMDILKGKISLINGNRKYFNSGVLLYDLATWRREHCHEMIVTTLGKEVNLVFPDQNLLNNAIPEQLIRWLPPKYNDRSPCPPPPPRRSAN